MIKPLTGDELVADCWLKINEIIATIDLDLARLKGPIKPDEELMHILNTLVQIANKAHGYEEH